MWRKHEQVVQSVKLVSKPICDNSEESPEKEKVGCDNPTSTDNNHDSVEKEVDTIQEVEKNVEERQPNEVIEMSSLINNSVKESNDREGVIINIISSEEENEQSQISMNVDDLISSLEGSEAIQKLLDRNEESDDGKKKVCENLIGSIMSRMEEFNESNTGDSMKLYRLRQSNELPVSVSATTETDLDDEQIVIVRKNKAGKKGKECRKCESMSVSE